MQTCGCFKGISGMRVDKNAEGWERAVGGRAQGRRLGLTSLVGGWRAASQLGGLQRKAMSFVMPRQPWYPCNNRSPPHVDDLLHHLRSTGNTTDGVSDDLGGWRLLCASCRTLLLCCVQRQNKVKCTWTPCCASCTPCTLHSPHQAVEAREEDYPHVIGSADEHDV